jgi:hypothetical protein
MIIQRLDKANSQRNERVVNAAFLNGKITDGGNILNFSKLEQNICDVIKEEQIKLGYRKEVIRLYYPLMSLNRFLQAELNIEQMQKVLPEFCHSVEDKLGKIEVSNKGERFCFCFPQEASEYIHTHTEHEGFLYDFIETVSRHDVSIDDVLKQFKKYSDCVHIEKTAHDEFDYLVYFENGKPDSFRYCLKDEGCHIIYHRFTPDDYRDFHFS